MKINKITKQNNQFDTYSGKRCSFILPIKNSAKYLDSTFRHCRELVKPDDELIVIDGGSKDGSFQIIKKYRDLISHYISEPDIFVTQAFNKGILLAQGKYIKNLADDDIIHPEAMEQVIRILDINPKIDVLVCGGTKQYGRNISTVWLPANIGYGQDLRNPLIYGACGAGFVMRRRVFSLGLIPLGKTGDIEFILSCIKNKATVKFCRINLFHHVISNKSTIILHKNVWEKDLKKTVKTYFPRKFYYSYLIKKIMNTHPLNLEGLYKKIPFSRLMLFPLSYVFQKVLKIIFKKPQKNNQLREKYIWDNGFS